MKQLFRSVRYAATKAVSISSRNIGQRSERTAEKHLTAHGLQIVERNYRSRYGEIDLIFRDNDQYVFIEVRSRKDLRFGRPGETVDIRKQKKIYKTAQSYLQQHRLDVSCRFDVVEIYLDASLDDRKYNWIKNAFDVSGDYL